MRKKKYEKELKYCLKKGHNKTNFWKKEKMKMKGGKANIFEYIVHEDIFPDMIYAHVKRNKSTKKYRKCLLLNQYIRHIW